MQYAAVYNHFCSSVKCIFTFNTHLVNSIILLIHIIMANSVIKMQCHQFKDHEKFACFTHHLRLFGSRCRLIFPQNVENTNIFMNSKIYGRMALCTICTQTKPIMLMFYEWRPMSAICCACVVLLSALLCAKASKPLEITAFKDILLNI